MKKTEFGIKIVADLVNIAIVNKKNLTLDDLAIILILLGQKTSKGKEYVKPGKLVKKARDHFNTTGDKTTAKNIKLVFSHVKIDLL